jgi:hypothetical protein
MKKIKLFLLLVLSTVASASISAQSDKGAIKGGIIYEKRTDLVNAPDCNASETYLKKKVKAQLANYYKDYPSIAVDFTSFKGQNGYSHKEDPAKIVYPYKIEMLVYLKRKLVKEGKEQTEYSTWKYDAVYEYATGPGKKCEFSLVPSSQTTLITRKIY